MNIVRSKQSNQELHTMCHPEFISGSYEMLKQSMKQVQDMVQHDRKAVSRSDIKSGQSLVEVLVSLSIATLVLSAITVAVTYSLRNTQFSKNQNLATQYASEGMEIVRKIRDSKSSLSGFLGANDSSKSYCLDQDSQTLVAKGIVCGQNVGRLNIGEISNYLYVREVIIDPPDPNGECKTNYKVTVSVSWSDGACVDRSNLFCHKANLISCFADRGIVPKP